MNITIKTLTTGVLFFLSVITGFWLSNFGKPLNSVILTIHKLIALGAVIFTVTLIRDLVKCTKIKPDILILIIILGLLILVLFVSGALLSLEKSPYNAIKTIHGLTTILIIITITMTVYWLVIKN